ncbi:hypothetical protein [Streptomyces sp. NPDC002851]
MADWLSVIVAVVSAVIAALSVVWARRLARGTFTDSAFELARSLHHDLTTGDVAKARDLLESFGRGARPQDADGAYAATVRDAYFTLLWCFERVWAGRRSLVADQNHQETRAAVKFLDEMITWHVAHWADSWPSLRAALTAPDMVPGLSDGDSLAALRNLAEAVAATPERVGGLESLMQGCSPQRQPN